MNEKFSSELSQPKKKPISRRDFLKISAGAAATLPFLVKDALGGAKDDLLNFDGGKTNDPNGCKQKDFLSQKYYKRF